MYMTEISVIPGKLGGLPSGSFESSLRGWYAGMEELGFPCMWRREMPPASSMPEIFLSFPMPSASEVVYELVVLLVTTSQLPYAGVPYGVDGML